MALKRDEILEYPYTGVVTRITPGVGRQDDTEEILYEGVMDEHQTAEEVGRTLQTASYILRIPLTKAEDGSWIVPHKGDKVELNRWGEVIRFEVDNAEVSQLGGVSIYASRQSW